MMKAPRLIGAQFFPTQQVEAPEADEERLAVSVVRTSVGRSRLPYERLVLRPHICHDVATYTTHGGLPDESAIIVLIMTMGGCSRRGPPRISVAETSSPHPFGY